MKKLLLILFVLLPALAFANLVPVVHKNGKWGFKESKYSDKFIIKPKFEKVNEFTGQYAFVCQKGLWGVIGKDGKFVVAPKYSSASKPYNGITIVQLGSKYGLIKDCKDILRIEYESIEHLRTGAFRLKKDGRVGLADANGRIIIPLNYDDVSICGDGYKIQSNGRVGLADANGKIIIPIEYQDITTYNKGYKLKANRLFGLADVSGKIFLPVEYQDIAIYNNGYKLKANNLFGLADASGKIFLPVEYEDVAMYGNGYKLKANSKYGLADANGKIFISVEYEDIADYNGGYKLKANGCVGLADASGKIVLETKYKEVLYLQNNTFAVYSNKLEFINSDGKIVEQPNNVLLYTSNNGKTIDRSRGGYSEDYKYYWQVNVVSNTYQNGQGVMIFDRPIAEIGEKAFYDCNGLASITIPNSVTSIGDSAFYGCDGLTSAIIGGGVIGKNAFAVCDNLKNVTLDKSVTSIGAQAFYNCDGLTSITIPNSVIEIGDRAFEDCDGLTNITIPNSVTSIGESAFSGCYGLTRVNVNISDLARYCTSNLMYSIRGEKHLYLNGKEITNLVIPNSVTSIGDKAFYDCDGLASITIPNSVIEIGDRAFEDCGSLVNITLGSGVTHIGESVFYDCRHLKEIHFPDLAAWCRVYWDGKNEEGDRETKVFVGGKDIEQIRDSYEITIPSGVEHIADYTFAYFRNLSSITIPNSVTSIGNGAFKYCTSLKSVTIPNSVTEIGSYAFYNCDGLTSVTIGNSVTEIGERAFGDCYSLKSVYFKSTRPPHLGLAAFVVVWYNKDMNFYVPKASIKEYQYAGSWNSLYWNIKAGNY